MKFPKLFTLSACVLALLNMIAFYVVLAGFLAYRVDSTYARILGSTYSEAEWFLTPHQVSDWPYALLTSPLIVIVEGFLAALMIKAGSVLFVQRSNPQHEISDKEDVNPVLLDSRREDVNPYESPQR